MLNLPSRQNKTREPMSGSRPHRRQGSPSTHQNTPRNTPSARKEKIENARASNRKLDFHREGGRLCIKEKKCTQRNVSFWTTPRRTMMMCGGSEADDDRQTTVEEGGEGVHAGAGDGSIYARSPRIRLASWMSFGMMVTRLAWMAHRLVSSNRPTRYASLASCSAPMAALWKRRSVLKS